jgi:hypothetical protein
MAAAAAMFEIKVNAIKWAIITRFFMKFGTQTKKNMLSSKITILECRLLFKSQKRKGTEKKQQKLIVKSDIFSKGQCCMSAKL